MGIIKFSIEVDSPAEKVFIYISDEHAMLSLIRLPLGFKLSVKKLTENPLEVGSEYKVFLKMGCISLKLWDVKIIELVEDKLYHTKSISGLNIKSSKSIVEPIQSRTKLTRFVEYELPLSFLGEILDRLWIHRVLERKTAEWLQNIKKQIETERSI